MLVRQHRFHGHGSVRRVYARGQTVRGPISTLRYIPINRQPSWRAAVVVSKKVHKSAVVRNRIRRRVYEIIRTHALPQTTSTDLVFIIHSPTALDMPYEELETQIVRQIKKATSLP